MQQSHEEGRGGGAGAGGVGAELDETPERSLTTEAVSEAKSFAPSSALASAGATCALYRADEPPSSRPKKPRRGAAAAARRSAARCTLFFKVGFARR